MQSNKRSSFWLLAAATAPIAHFADCGWLTAAAVALAVLPLALLPKSWEGMPKSLALLEILWLGAVTGILLRGSAVYWPSDSAHAVPLTLLALAAFTGSAAAPRAGNLMALCMALLAVPLAASGAAHLDLNWLRPKISPWPMGLTLALLIPNLPASGERRSGITLICAGALALALSALIQGTISRHVATSVPDAFFQTARTLGYLEPVAAVAMTLGWYAMAVYLFQSAGEVTKSAELSPKLAAVLHTGTSTAVLLFSWQPQIMKITVLSAFFWVLIPFFMFLKKVKNSA
ncbi:MAG: hypothetical protein IKD27_05705 [Oscillospiraceae bacterium]|nr:hypothetical protein [Oscillospiraceae bacterium]